MHSAIGELQEDIGPLTAENLPNEAAAESVLRTIFLMSRGSRMAALVSAASRTDFVLNPLGSG